MNSSKKILLISLIPGILTLVFILYILLPVIGKMDRVKDNLEAEKASYSAIQSKIASFKADKALLNKIQKLKDEIPDFDIKVPPKNELAILLYDTEKFAGGAKVKISSVTTKTPKSVDIIDPKTIAQQNSNTQRKKKKTDDTPAKLIELPLEIVVVGYYPDVLRFIGSIENYQRKVMVNGVSVENYSDDKDKPVPRVQMAIDCSVYTFFRQSIDKEKV